MDSEDSRPAQREALSQISTKTPPLVREEEHDYVTSALEYNSIIRHDYAQNVSRFDQHMSTVNHLYF
jgi:phosphatidylinositol 4-kinase A